MQLKWVFPPTGGGTFYGFHDSGQEHFRTSAWENAIREIIQNSLDAVRDRDRPVTVRIFQTEIPSSEIGADDLARHMVQASRCARRQHDDEGVSFYTGAIGVLKRETIPMLAIIDTNTTGLVEDKWEALVYQEGTPNKRGMSAAGGSFGIGKNAPYLVSALKTVCYSTRYLDRGRQENFIARCKISAHPDPYKPHRELQNIGFGTKAPITPGLRAPPTRGREIHGAFRLKAAGSGIFVLGFDPLHRDWIKKAKRTVASNFFAAIHEKKLEIQIEHDRITHDTLDGIFETVASREPERHYYHLFRSPHTQTESVSGKLGRFTLSLAVGDEGYRNSVAYVNRRGMLVTDARQSGYNPFHTSVGTGWAKYEAVIVAADDKTDERVRKMEPPNHRSIEYKRIRDPAKRERMREHLAAIRRQIEEIISEAIRRNVKPDEQPLDEIGHIMSIEKEEGDRGSDAGGITGPLSTHETEPKPVAGAGAAAAATMEPAPGSGEGARPDDPKKPGSSKSGDAAGSEPRPANRRRAFAKARAIRRGGGLRVAFTPVLDTAAPVQFMIRPAGEEPKYERVLRLSAVRAVSPAGIRVEANGGIVTVGSAGQSRIVLDLDVDGDPAYTGYEILEYARGGEA